MSQIQVDKTLIISVKYILTNREIAMTFRIWLQHTWHDHVTEVEQWTGRAPAYTPQDYFKKYKWWLWREYVRSCKNATAS